MKKLRSGYTTGACAAAAAKAATLMLMKGEKQHDVTIPFPDGSRVSFPLHDCRWFGLNRVCSLAVVMKDAGDDPDVTNGARIEVTARWADDHDLPNNNRHIKLPNAPIILAAGVGVGMVTKPGLSVPAGEPAINPVPRSMIREAVNEALRQSAGPVGKSLVVTVSIPNGEELAASTLNQRLGIMGGLSILGTTGIVRPVSAEAWTATISASLDVAFAAGIREIILSTGRTSELAVQQHLRLPEEACVMMGDYLHYCLVDAGKHGFRAIHLAAMWAKILKGAMRIPQTHVRHGALEIEQALAFLAGCGAGSTIGRKLAGSNTAREIYDRLVAMDARDIIGKVCRAARDYAQEVSGLPVTVYLVDSSRQIVETAGSPSGTLRP